MKKFFIAPIIVVFIFLGVYLSKAQTPDYYETFKALGEEDIDTVIEASKSEDIAIKIAAMKRLGDFNTNKKALARLHEMLSETTLSTPTTSNREIFVTLIASLARHADPSTVPILINRYRELRDPDLRRVIIRSFGSYKPITTLVTFLRDELLSTSDPRMAIDIAQTFLDMKYKKAYVWVVNVSANTAFPDWTRKTLAGIAKKLASLPEETTEEQKTQEVTK